MKSIINILLLSSSIGTLICGCASNKEASSIVKVSQFTDKRGTVLWAHFDATQRQTIMHVDSAGTITMLSEQSPDAGDSKATKIEGKGKAGVVDIDPSLSFQTTIEKLTDRSASLMIVRDELYRLGEAYFNGAVNDSVYSNKYSEVIKQAQDLIIAEAKLEEQKAKTQHEIMLQDSIKLAILKLESPPKSDTTKTTKVGTDKKVPTSKKADPNDSTKTGGTKNTPKAKK